MKKRDSTKMKAIHRGIYALIASERGKTVVSVKMAIRRGDWELKKRYAEILNERVLRQREAESKYNQAIENALT
jgi:hypothetical protein